MSKCSLISAVVLAFFWLVPAALSDEIRLKSGEVLKGRIVSEGEDFLRIEIVVSETIRETMMVSRADVAEVVKEAPDNVEFAKIEHLVPTSSLLGVNQYRSMIETGPDAFLRNFPESAHVPRVQEIRATLAEELDRVERGYVKVGEDWISPQDRAQFEARVNSRIRLLQMRRHAERGDANSLILAMREYEQLERSYRGTPAHVDAIEVARSTLPNLGRQLQGLLRDVEYRNAEYERNKANLDDTGKAQVEAARRREEESHKAAVEADKKAGIKWVRLNPRSKPSLEEYIKFATAELQKLQAYDVAELRRQATLLSQADDLIARGEFSGASAKLAEAGAGGGSGSRSAKSSGSGGAGSYAAGLSAKLNALQAERTVQAKAREASAKAKAITGRRKGDEAGATTRVEPAVTEEGAETAEAAAEESPEAVQTETAEERPAPVQDDFAALAGGSRSAKADLAAKGAPAATPARAPRVVDEAEREARRVAAADTGGGFPKWLLIPIVTVLLLVTVIVLKVLGIGAKKEGVEE